MSRTRMKNIREKLWKAQSGLCYYCKIPTILPAQPRGKITEDNVATIDHIVARADGGSDKQENMVMACFKCNNEKGSEYAKKPKKCHIPKVCMPQREGSLVFRINDAEHFEADKILQIKQLTEKPIC